MSSCADEKLAHMLCFASTNMNVRLVAGAYLALHALQRLEQAADLAARQAPILKVRPRVGIVTWQALVCARYVAELCACIRGVY